jgi:preprotein translocase subunit SecE
MSAEMEKQGRRRRRRAAQEEEEVQEESAEERGLTAKKGRATVGRRNPQQEETRKLGLFGRTVRYFRGVQSELDKVTWPSRQDTIRLTRIVLLVTIAAALILGAISFLFTELFVLGLNNPIIFLIAGVVTVVVVFGYTRYAANRGSTTNYSSRL